MFARVAHGISGCIEAPIQLITTVFLIMRGLLDVPWTRKLTSTSISLGFNNQVDVANIPMWTMIFSVFDILKEWFQLIDHAILKSVYLFFFYFLTSVGCEKTAESLIDSSDIFS